VQENIILEGFLVVPADIVGKICDLTGSRSARKFFKGFLRKPKTFGKA